MHLRYRCVFTYTYMCTRNRQARLCLDHINKVDLVMDRQPWSPQALIRNGKDTWAARQQTAFAGGIWKQGEGR